MYALSYLSILLRGQMDTGLEACVPRNPASYVFLFLFKHANQIDSSCFWVWDVEGHTAGTSSKQFRQGLSKLALGCPALGGGGLFEWLQTHEKTRMMRNSIQVVARVRSASDTSLPCFSTADQSLDIMEQSTALCLVSLSTGRLAEEVRGTVGRDRRVEAI